MPAMRVCSVSGCPNVTTAGRCDECRAAAEKVRGTAAQRGYNSAAHQRFRVAVLRREPICTLCRRAPSNHADHYPTSKRDLILAGINPHDPARGRGLCHSCHSRETAVHQPGGWNAMKRGGA